MRLMVVDTALGLCTVGVFEVDERGARPLGLRSEPMVKGHSERIAGFARDAAAQAGLPFADLDRIGVTVGPGSFTGLRVGLAFAQGLAAARRPVNEPGPTGLRPVLARRRGGRGGGSPDP